MGVTVDEREIMREIRWWSEDEIAKSRERIFPENLAERVRVQSGRRERNRG
jgi:8-oxo-dGTP diphosphatase